MNNQDVAKDTDAMIRVRLKPELKSKWGKVLDDRKISQQEAVENFIGWLVDQDPLLQIMLFGQAPQDDHGHIARIVLGRMTGGKGKR
jgi:hypothetical protein